MINRTSLNEDHYREHGQQVFYAIEKDGTIHNLLRSPHLFTVEEAIASHMMRFDTSSTYASKYDSFEKDDIDMTRLAVEYRLTKRSEMPFVPDMITTLPFMITQGQYSS
jgi:hypothetical protein